MVTSRYPYKAILTDAAVFAVKLYGTHVILISESSTLCTASEWKLMRSPAVAGVSVNEYHHAAFLFIKIVRWTRENINDVFCPETKSQDQEVNRSYLPTKYFPL